MAERVIGVDVRGTKVAVATMRPDDPNGATAFSSRAVQSIVDDQSVPLRLEIVRPPTFAQLERVLAERRGEIHIVHFDVKGCVVERLVSESREVAWNTMAARVDVRRRARPRELPSEQVAKKLRRLLPVAAYNLEMHDGMTPSARLRR